MQWYHNLTIRNQLLFSLGVLGIGFVLIIVMYIRSVAIEENALHTAESLAKFEVLVEDAHLNLKDAQTVEANFKLTRDPIYIDKHAKDMSRLHTDLESLGSRASMVEATELLQQIVVHLKDYEAAFIDEVGTLRVIGLTPSDGLLGILNQSAAAMEKALKVSKGMERLTVTLLQMRRYEKDYLLYEDKDHLQNLLREEQRFQSLLKKSSASKELRNAISENMLRYQEGVVALAEAIKRRLADTEVLTEKADQMELIFDQLLSHAAKTLEENSRETTATQTMIRAVFISLVLFIAALVGGIFGLLIRRLNISLKVLVNTISRIGQGEYDVRTKLRSQDELGQLGRALDQLLDQRLAGLAQAQKDNDILNDSLVEVLEAVALLSAKDLTISVPVAEDVTGAVSDSINQMASETAKVLRGIQNVAEQVEQAASTVRSQGNKVSDVAEQERLVVENTISRLESAAKAMNDISARAQVCNQIAAKASESTAVALKTVTNTSEGMIEIREIISETEKRIKRLGERSQEINGIVEIINTVAERTHVLALNASMQAATAGEAGRGFAVVADEVQRLAESSRTSNAQIRELVNSIQAETSETMATMNKVITQVVHGSELAEQAGKQMLETQQTTTELVSAVVEISERSINQAKVSADLRERASLIKKSTEETGVELKAQAAQTHSLVEYADNMLKAVREFKLPAA